MTRRKLLLAFLLLSLGANLFLIGGISYRTLSMQQGRDGRPLPPNLGWLVRDLSEERRAELDTILRTGSEQIEPLRQEIYRAQVLVNELMSAEPFDAEALEEAFAELRAVSNRYQEITQTQTVSILEQMTVEERETARDYVSERGRRDGRPGPGAGPGGRPPPPPGMPPPPRPPRPN